MNWKRNLQLSVHTLWRARSRTILSASAMAVGITSMVLLLGLGAGADLALQSALEEMGRNLLVISAERTDLGAMRGAGRQFETLLLSDLYAVVDEVAPVERAAPIAMTQRTLRYGGEALSSTVIGTLPQYQITKNVPMSVGRFFDDEEVDQYSRVAVIGSYLVSELFHGEIPLGKRFLVGDIPFVVIGVIQEMGVDPTGADQDNRILIPVSTVQRRVMNVDHLDRVFLQIESREVMETATQEVRELLRMRHDITDGVSDDFTIRSQDALLAALEQADRSLSRLLTVLAGLTLGLASVGLLAISLLSVRERESEIGLRLTVGALPHQVLVQFLAETVIVAALGAVTGLIVGIAGITLGEALVGWRLALTWEAVAYPFMISMAIALLFGAYPAWRAAKLDPIVALRSQ